MNEVSLWDFTTAFFPIITPKPLQHKGFWWVKILNNSYFWLNILLFIALFCPFNCKIAAITASR
jgi:hypothetical protein